MPQRKYFYTENNKMKQYKYCTLCGAGPFKENDFEHIIFICGDKQKTYYCNNCNLYHHIKKVEDEDENR